MHNKYSNYHGLTESEVEERIQQGKLNKIKNATSQSYKSIFLSNSLTFFNMLNVILLILVLSVGSYKNTLFILVVVSNTFIGIYQEIKSKKTLDKLSILTASSTHVLRNKTIEKMHIDRLVVDDLVILYPGDQVPADAEITCGQLEINEALLTGESDHIQKKAQEILYSGSFVTAGVALCRITHVGEDSYIGQLTKEAKKFKKPVSLLQSSLDKIVKVCGVVLLPLCTLLFLKQFYFGDNNLQDSVVTTVAAALGMIPEGLVLLTSIALMISVIHLAKKRTLVQELHCIDSLARADILCLDKTGTLTEGKMQVEDIITLRKDVNCIEAIGNLMAVLSDNNATAVALRMHYPNNNTFGAPLATIPFSPERKYSGAAFHQFGTYYIGAGQFLFPDSKHSALHMKCADYAGQGFRVLVLARSKEPITDVAVLPNDLEPCALLLLSDVIRRDAHETLRYFDAQGVTCKIISGDDPVTVAFVADRAGLKGASRHIDATTLQSRDDIYRAVQSYNVFGRVTPEQKKEMIVCLKNLGHTVAMTGDGVNDVLALKEADCSIAMATGSDAAKRTASLVLLDNQFSAMPHIVNEGRRVMNNITMSASLFLIQTIFSILITVATVLAGKSYPFEPIQLTVINAFCVGIPAFLLNYEANFEQVRGRFLKTVMHNAFPPAFTIAFGTTMIVNIGLILDIPKITLSTLCIVFTAWNYMIVQRRIYSPLSPYRKYVLYATQLLYFVAIIVGREILSLGALTYLEIILLVAMLNFSPLMHDASNTLFRNFYDRYVRFRIRRKQRQAHT